MRRIMYHFLNINTLIAITHSSVENISVSKLNASHSKSYGVEDTKQERMMRIILNDYLNPIGVDNAATYHPRLFEKECTQ